MAKKVTPNGDAKCHHCDGTGEIHEFEFMPRTVHFGVVERLIVEAHDAAHAKAILRACFPTKGDTKLRFHLTADPRIGFVLRGTHKNVIE